MYILQLLLFILYLQFFFFDILSFFLGMKQIKKKKKKQNKSFRKIYNFLNKKSCYDKNRTLEERRKKKRRGKLRVSANIRTSMFFFATLTKKKTFATFSRLLYLFVFPSPFLLISLLYCRTMKKTITITNKQTNKQKKKQRELKKKKKEKKKKTKKTKKLFYLHLCFYFFN